MKIYTKGGDAGETGLYGGARVAKDEPRINAYGTFDELNAAIGVVLGEEGLPGEMRSNLVRIQGELFQLGAELSTPPGKSAGIALLEPHEVSELEHEIDAMESKLKPLKNFILPGGSRPSAFLHLCRTISRRAERHLITLHRTSPVRDVVLQYVNRLSDYLFVCARLANAHVSVADSEWKPVHQAR